MLLASMLCGSSVLFCELMVEVGASCRFALSHFCVLGPYPLVAFLSCLCPWLTAGDAAVLRRRHPPSRVLEEDPVAQRPTTWSVFAAYSGLCMPWVASGAPVGSDQESVLSPAPGSRGSSEASVPGPAQEPSPIPGAAPEVARAIKKPLKWRGCQWG